MWLSRYNVYIITEGGLFLVEFFRIQVEKKCFWFLLTLFSRYLLSAPYFFGFTNNRLQVSFIHRRCKVVSWVKEGDSELPVNVLVGFSVTAEKRK